MACVDALRSFGGGMSIADAGSPGYFNGEDERLALPAVRLR
jgi:hypothetical protein